MTLRPRRALIVPAAAALAMIAPDVSRAETVITSPFRGVTHYHRVEPAGAVVPRQVVMHIVEIDLATPGLGFLTTPGNGDAPGEFTAQTTSQFVQQHNLQIGLNGDFFSSAGTGPNGEIYRNVTNLAASNGELISPWPANPGTARGAMNISQSNVATLVRAAGGTTENFLTNPALTPYNAIGGNARMLNNGTVITSDTTIHPRTCIGYVGNRLFLFAVDGRQPGYSDGMTLVEIANFMKTQYGLTHLLNLDGGGSTTLVMADPTRRVVNRPSDGTERYNGNNFGVFAGHWPQWNVDAGGNWSVASNWSQGVPNAPGAAAKFGGAIKSPRTVTVNVAATVGTLLFENASAYTIAGTQPITLDSTAGNALVRAYVGSHTVNAPLTLLDNVDVDVVAAGRNLAIGGALNNAAGRAINKFGAGTMTISGPQTHAAGAVLNLNAGVLSMTSNAGSATAANLTINVKQNTASLASKQNLNALTIAAGGVASIMPAGANTMKTKSLSMGIGARFDVADNNLVVDYAGASSPLGAVTSPGVYGGITGMLQRGRGVDGAWVGPGLHSSRAAVGDGLTALAIAEASEVLFLTGAQTATWFGQTVDATSVLVRYTYDGDADLNGYIDAVDYGMIDNFIQFPGSFGYGHGDFNYDGVIDAADYGIIDNSIQLQGPPFPAAAAAAASSSVVAVPEPSALAAVVLTALAATAHRRGLRSRSGSVLRHGNSWSRS